MNVGDFTAIILAGTGAAGTYTAWRLGKRGQTNDEKQQAAATKLQGRIAAFDELESLNDRLSTENKRLHDLVGEAESRGDLRLATQGRRCRATVDELIGVVATLRSVVLDEVTRESGRVATEKALEHLGSDHAEDDHHP